MNSFKLLVAVVFCCSITTCFAVDPTAAATATVNRLTIPTQFWNITNAKDESCMLFQMGIRANVFYTLPGSTETHVFSSNVPVNATATGTCQFNMTSSFSLMWTDNGNDFALHFHFYLLKAVPPKLVDWWRTRSIVLDYNLAGIRHAMPAGQQSGSVNSTYLEQYRALSHQSLICGTGYQFNFAGDKGTVDIVNVRAQPFDVVGNKFSFKIWYCEHDSPFAPKKDNTVPILVGSLITASFLITLLAYVFSRHRVRSGYQSM